MTGLFVAVAHKNVVVGQVAMNDLPNMQSAQEAKGKTHCQLAEDGSIL